MYIVPIAWLYVALMMSFAEANNTNGTLLGACITFVLYGLLPVGLVLYIMGTPARKRRLRAQALSEREAALSGSAPYAGGHAAGDAIAAVRKEP